MRYEAINKFLVLGLECGASLISEGDLAILRNADEDFEILDEGAHSHLIWHEFSTSLYLKRVVAVKSKSG